VPTSDEWGKEEWVLPKIKEMFEGKNPRVIDVGAGSGTYSRLLRSSISGHWIAVEAWKPYIEEYDLPAIYDEIVCDDIRHRTDILFGDGGPPDLVIMGDVLEHMSKEDAKDIIYCSIFPPTTLLVCIPLLHLEQDAVYGNPFEIHRMENHWNLEEMTEFLDHLVSSGDYSTLDTHVGDVVGYFLLKP
jgi:hypothetical protein